MAKEERYIINGVEYRSLDEVPAHLRNLVTDSDGDGIPDFVEQHMGDVNANTVVKEQTYNWTGDPREMPPEIRERIARMGGKLPPGDITVRHENASGFDHKLIDVEANSGPGLKVSVSGTVIIVLVAIIVYLLLERFGLL